MNINICTLRTILLGLTLAGSSLAQRTYTVAEIPLPSGVSDPGKTSVIGIAGDGRMIGTYLSPNSAFFGGNMGQCYAIEKGIVTYLPAAGLSCDPRAVNTKGDFTGTLTAPTPPGVTTSQAVPSFAFIYSDGAFNPIQFPPSMNVTWSAGSAINDKSEVAGYLITGGLQRAFLYSNGTVTLLPGLANSVGDLATAIDNKGDVAGSSTISGGGLFGPRLSHAVVWPRDGDMVDLGTLSPGLSAEVAAINNSGQVAVNAVRQAFFDIPHGKIGVVDPLACLWDGQKLQPISFDAPIQTSSVGGFNDAGEIVGLLVGLPTEAPSNNAMAFYSNGGSAVPLDSLLADPPSGLHLDFATFISNKGEIVAQSGSPATKDFISGQTSPSTLKRWLLTPVQPPASADGQ